jgi:hypothetical protein
MYLLKHICIELNSVINQLIVALVLTTSAYMFSAGANAGTTTQLRSMSGAAIKGNNGHINTNNSHNTGAPNHTVNRLRIIITGVSYC